MVAVGGGGCCKQTRGAQSPLRVSLNNNPGMTRMDRALYVNTRYERLESYNF